MECDICPPKTTFEFPVKVTNGSVLEFGYTIAPYSTERHNGKVNFSIYFEWDKAKRCIFSKVLDPTNPSHWDIFFEKIEFEDKDIKEGRLLFVTQSHRAKEKKPGISSWVAPRLYLKKDPKKTRNIILISLDTVRRDFIGVFNADPELSPNIDSLAKDCVVFENAYSQASWTLPSHVSLLTGLNPASHGTNIDSNTIPEKIKTLPQFLRERGYINFAYTGLIFYRHGFPKGFDHYKFADGTLFPDASKPVFERAEIFIRNYKYRDFFLFLHTMQFHSPFPSAENIRQKILKNKRYLMDSSYVERLFKKAKYGKSLNKEEIEEIKLIYKVAIRTIDEHLIGPLIKTLKEEGIYDQTMIIITSDHGEEIHDHGKFGHGHTLYNELIRVPLLIKFPKSKFAGKKVKKNVRHVDIVPTILDVIDMDYSKYNFDGKSLIPLIEEDEKEDRICFSENVFDGLFVPPIPPKVSVIWRNYKLIYNDTIKDWKKYFGAPPASIPFEFFDLEKDPLEKRNNYSEDNEVVKDLLTLIREYKKKEAPRGKPLILDEETREKLRALGYIK